jgi:hypothetical protein
MLCFVPLYKDSLLNPGRRRSIVRFVQVVVDGAEPKLKAAAPPVDDPYVNG